MKYLALAVGVGLALAVFLWLLEVVTGELGVWSRGLIVGGVAVFCGLVVAPRMTRPGRRGESTDG